MIQLLTQAADENNENLGQWSLLTTTIVVRPQQPLTQFRSVHSKLKKFKKWRSFVNPKDFNPKDRRNITPWDKLRWIPPQIVAAATFVPVKVIEKKKINQTPSNCQGKIQSWMCWFQDQYEKHSLQMFVQGPTTEDGDVSTKNWKLLTVYFQVMKGEIVTQGRLLKFPLREDIML